MIHLIMRVVCISWLAIFPVRLWEAKAEREQFGEPEPTFASSVHALTSLALVLYAALVAFGLVGCTTQQAQTFHSYVHPATDLCAAMGAPIASLVTGSTLALTAAGPIALGICAAIGTQPTQVTTLNVTQSSSAGPPPPAKIEVKQ